MTPTRPVATVRLATLLELELLTDLVTRSFRSLGAGHYEPAVIEAALGTTIRVDRGLIEDGTYFVAERDGVIVGSGGWSAKHPTVRGAALPTPRAEVRAMFVAPEWAGRGVGRALLAAAEDAIRTAGFREAYLVATRSGVAFYTRAGYAAIGEHSVRLGAHELALTTMRRALPA